MDRPQDLLRRKLRLSRAVISYERGWSLLAPVLAVLATFLATAWFGVFAALPPLARAALTLLFAAALVYSLWRLRGFAAPRDDQAIDRLDRDSSAPHRPP